MSALSAGLAAHHDHNAAALRRVEAETTHLDVDAATQRGHATRHHHDAELADAHGQSADAAAHRHDAALAIARADTLHAAAVRVRAAMQHVPTQREVHGG